MVLHIKYVGTYNIPKITKCIPRSVDIRFSCDMAKDKWPTKRDRQCFLEISIVKKIYCRTSYFLY